MNTTEPPKRGRGRPATGRLPQHQFRCPDEEWALFEQAAEADGMTVATWLRKMAVKAATRAIKRTEAD